MSDLMKATMGVIVVPIILGMVCGVLFGSTSYLGRTQAVGYVVNNEQASFPYPHTTVTFTIEHPTSITDANYFTRTYYGYYEFELHQQVRVTADKHFFEWFPRIIEVEILG